VKGSHALQGKNSRKQSQHFSADLYILVLLKGSGAEGNQSSPKKL
jgi:hypothetical protein